jgi:superfamily II DNA/RNA helicase
LETTTFAELGLSAKLLAAVTAAGYTTPTPIQAQAIPVAVTGRDILGIAQTGTGKTAAFVMPMITRLETGRARARMPRSLILAPTRELAAQVEQSFIKYGTNHKLDVALLIGGVSMDEQVRKLDRGVDVLIATPGRMLDHFQRGRLMLMGVEILVIDEADRMLDMGFIPDIEKICKLLPPKRQTLFFSATMPPEITRLVNTFLNDPLRIEVARPATTAATITQRFVYCPDGEDYAKREALRELIRGETVRNAIIFCNRKRDVAIVHKSLVKHGFNAGALHGDMDQSSRTATLDKFRNGEIAFLAASDVAARGLDIPDVSHVFNYDVPWQADDYVHRIGRTGRAGKLGFSASLVSGEDFKALAEIEKITGEKAVWVGHAPTEEEIADGAKRKRGRGGRPGASGGASRGGSDRAGAGRPGADRGGRSGERSAGRGRGDRPPRRFEEGAASVEAAGEGGPAISAGSHDAPRRPRLGRRPRGGDQPAQAVAAPVGEVQQQRQDQPRQDQPRQDQPRQDRGRGERGRNDQPRAEGGGGRQRGERQPRQERGGREHGGGDQPAVQAVASESRREAQHEPVRSQPRDPAHSVRDRQQTRRDAPRHNQDNGPNQGFADNVPAFLRRPVKAKS